MMFSVKLAFILIQFNFFKPYKCQKIYTPSNIPLQGHCILAKVLKKKTKLLLRSEASLPLGPHVRVSLSFCSSHSFKRLWWSKHMKNICLLDELVDAFCTWSSNRQFISVGLHLAILHKWRHIRLQSPYPSCSLQALGPFTDSKQLLI